MQPALLFVFLVLCPARAYALTTWLQHPADCRMGMTPGFWDWNATAGARWAPSKPCPPYRNLLLEASNTLILLLGDSLDVHTLLSYCRLLKQKFSYKGKTHQHDFMGFCTNGSSTPPRGVQLAMKGIPGVHMHGPYNMHVQENFVNRTMSAKQEVLAKFGRTPDLVSISSCYWDIMRIHYNERRHLPRSNQYPRALVASWKANFTQLLSVVKQEFPEAVIVFRTEPLTARKTKVGLGTHHHMINQLRKAGMQVAEESGVHVIDVYSMVFGEDPQQYLATDGYHVVDKVNLDVMNIALNMLSMHKRSPLSPD